MPNLDRFIPKFRVHIAFSKANDEIVIAPLGKSLLSPYLDVEIGYFWSDLLPVWALPFSSPPEELGKAVRTAIKISKGNTHTPEAEALAKQYEERNAFVHARFGKDHSRFKLPPSTIFVLSTAVDKDTFLKEYDHVLVEDGEGSTLKLIESPRFGDADLLPAEQISADISNDGLGQRVCSLIRNK